MKKSNAVLTPVDVSRIIEMAWEDRTPFEAIQTLFGLSEKEVIRLMRREMKASSFRMWRARVAGRSTKHRQRAPYAAFDARACSPNKRR